MTVTEVDGPTYEQFRLHPASDLDYSARKSFHVALSPKIAGTLNRIGIADLEKHFVGKSVDVWGTLQATTLSLPASEAFCFYHLTIRDLDQFLSVSGDDASGGN
jgi:hypothetical protein